MWSPLTEPEVETMPIEERVAQILLRIDRITEDIGGTGGVRERLKQIETVQNLSREWERDHETKDDKRHTELTGAVASIAKAQAADEVRDATERKAIGAVLSPQYLVPLLAALGAAIAGYTGGSYAPPHAIVDAVQSADQAAP